jgi:quinolinate synthase
MAMNALQNLEQVLRDGSNEIHIDPALRDKAVLPIERMLNFAQQRNISGKLPEKNA